MDTKKLRQKVLDLAIHGKLVKQDPNDEPASILLDRIRAEKARLVKEGKIKKSDLVEKPISEDEIPFEVPEGWEWCRIGNVAYLLNGDRSSNYPNKNEYVPQGIAWINTGHIEPNGYLSTLSMNYITEDKYNSLSSGKIEKGDLVYCLRGATYGKVAKVEPYEKGAVASSLMIIRSLNINIRDYIFTYLKSSFSKAQLQIFANGAAQPNLAAKDVSKYLIPLPPLAEQHRIVKAVDELFEQIDIIERSEKELEEAANKTRDKLLNLAIQGHLVPQDPNEEPASVLLERIRAEKARLVKEGKLKKKDLEEKPISPDEIPFDIPEGWEWCRLGLLVDFSKSKSVKPDQIKENDWVLDLEDIEKGTGRLLQKKRMIDIASKSDKHIFKRGNVLYSKLRPYLNKVIIADEDGYCTSEILVFDFGEVYNKYAQYYLMSSFFVDYAMKDAYGVKMPRVGSNQGNSALLPLPPLSEQRRIVTKLEELLQEIDKLKA